MATKHGLAAPEHKAYRKGSEKTPGLLGGPGAAVLTTPVACCPGEGAAEPPRGGGL